MSYLNYDGLAYFKSKLTNWVDQNYLSKTNTGNLTVAGHVTFTNPITGDLDGKAKKDWLGQKIDETYIKEIATNDNAGTIVYTKGNGSTNHILIDLMQGATPSTNGRAGLVPMPTFNDVNCFLRGDGNWAVPTDVYVNQNLITSDSSHNNQFPILLSGTSGAPTTKENATVGYTNVVSVNPLTNALMASQFISKHPTYNRLDTITSKVQYSLSFTDIVSGAGHKLSEVVGYVDTPANGGEHELGFRLFGNPNVQGTEEDYIYMGVGLSKTNVAYGHAPSTPLPSAHNEPTDIITRDWLARNGSETGLVHTSMNETIDGTKTFVKKIVANDGMNATGNIATDTLTVRQDANVKGSLDVDTNLNVDGTSNLHGKVTAGNGLEVTGNTKTTTLTVTSGATVGTTLGVGGKATISGGLAVTSGTTTDTLTVTNGATISGGTTVATGNLTVTSGGVTASNGTGTFKNLNVTSNGTFGGTITANAANIGSGGLTVTGDTNLQNTTVKNLYVTSKIYDGDNNEYVQKVINDNRQTVINNLIKENGGLDQDNNHYIYVKTGDGIQLSSGYVTTRLKNQGGIIYDGSTANSKSLKLDIVDGGGIKYHVATTEEPYSGLVVDFSGTSEIAQNIADQMKADLLSSLGLQVPLTADKNVYVNPLHANASDIWHKLNSNNEETPAIDTNAGSTSRPFKTIAAAIRFITEGFSVGSKSVYLRVQAYAPDTAITAYNSLTSDQKAALDYAIDTNSNSSTYRQVIYYESLTLPSYNVTSGTIAIYGFGNNTSSTSAYSVAWTKASNDTKFYKPIIDTRDTTDNTCIGIRGKYSLYGLHLRNNINYRYTATTSQFPHTLGVSGNGIANVYGCTIESKYLYGMTHAIVSAGDAALTGNSVGYVDLRPVDANEGSIYFRAWGDYGGIPNEFYFDRGPTTYTIGENTANSNVNVHLFMIWENSLVDFPSTNTLSDGLYMIAEGNCTVFVACSGTCRATGGGLYAQSFRRWEGVDKTFRYYDPEPANNSADSYHLVTGKKYSVTNGGHCSSPRGGFPGSANGTVEDGVNNPDNKQTFSVYTGSTNAYDWNSSSLTDTIS